MATKKLKKKQRLRNNEYYDTQKIYDNLYSKAGQNQKFNNLYDIIISSENILLAYRNIKKNKGSKTKGTNTTTILDIGEQEPEKLIAYVRNRLANFKPMSVRRVEIPKDNGKTRPLGIPTMEDRLIQQCIKQVLEPICEAKFYKHSYGFRPNRSTHHAVARTLALTNRHNFQYVVDIDIKGFFDNVDHGKLLKQLWSLGIQDKRLICIISKMLKAEIKGIGVPTKGVPQGGVLSPILSNVVLNELDWWVASQWENHKTHTEYKNPTRKYELMRKGKLKEVFIVRYADDFKLFCKDRDTANKMFIATKQWLEERLGLEISPEKSKIVNLKKKYSEFLGIKLKLWKKGNKYVVKSHMTDKSIEKCKKQLKEKIKVLQHDANGIHVQHFNATVLGIHGYYKIASHINKDFAQIAFHVNKSLYCRTKRIKSKTGKKSKAYEKFYGKSKVKPLYIQGVALYPIHFVQTTPPVCFSQDVCNYTPLGRKKIHDKLQNFNYDTLIYLMNNPVKGQSVEFNDNRISLYVGQRGRCFITGEKLQISNMEVHHKTPKHLGGKDEYRNLVYVTFDVHKLIHATTQETIEKYLFKLEKLPVDLERLIKLRVLVGNCEITEKAQWWKEVLRDYQKRNCLTYRQLAKQLNGFGCTVQEQGIRQWLVPDSHIVGPREEATLRQIAEMTRDSYLMNDVSDYFNACRTVRRQRKKILELIGKAIEDKLSGNLPPQESELKIIYDNVENLSETLELEAITFLDEGVSVPINLINKPITDMEVAS